VINKFTTHDSKNQFAITIATWIVPIIFLYAFLITFLSSFSFSSNLQNINDSVAEGSLGNKLFWIFLLSISVFVWRKLYKNRIKTLNLHIYLLIAYISLEVLSAVWSAVPLISLRRSIQQTIILFCILTPFLLGIDKNQILFKVCAILAFIVLINIVLIPLFGIPSFGYNGTFPQKNLLGQISTIAFFLCVYAAIQTIGKNRVFFIFSAALAILLVVISRSKTSLALLMIVPFISYVFITIAHVKNPLTRSVLILINITVIFSIISASILVPFDIYDISNLLFHDRTFTGRTRIWEFAGYYINQAPIIGYGYGSFWGIGSATKAIGEGFIGGLLQAHDGYVDIILETGYLGLTIASLFLLALLRQIVSIPKNDKWLAILLLSCVIFILLNNTMESSLFRSYVPLWVTLLLSAGLSIQSKAQRKPFNKSGTNLL
jgi:O-antigen ligase